MKSSPTWTIGELAARFGLEAHVLRHWEDRGLLDPERDAAGRRRFGESDAWRVAVILASKAAGMGLDQVRALVDGEARDRHRILERQLAELDARAEALARARHMAQHALECEAHDITACPTFRGHVAGIVAGERRGLPLGPDAAWRPATGAEAVAPSA